MNPEFVSQHAQKRMRQRGIPEQAIGFLFKYGKREHDHHGCTVVFLTSHSRERIAREADQSLLKRLEPALDIYAVVDTKGFVVTVGHRTHRINRH
jgi:hypothetical protein